MKRGEDEVRRESQFNKEGGAGGRLDLSPSTERSPFLIGDFHLNFHCPPPPPTHPLDGDAVQNAMPPGARSFFRRCLLIYPAR